MADRIRVGVIGAGNNTRSRHIPGLRAIDGAEVVAVANRSLDSARRVADEFGIDTCYADWRELLDNADVDAIVIGTWPDSHSTYTCAALDAGKHVMCEARMAATADEAHQMLAKSREHPGLVAQIVPSPFTLRVDATIKELLRNGYLGDLYALNVSATTSEFADTGAPPHWRHQRRFSGRNILTMGIWYEATMRWVGHATSVLAATRTFITQRTDPQTGEAVPIDVPDHVNILTDIPDGAAGNYQFSAVTGRAPTSGAWLYGSAGTVHFDAATGDLFAGQTGDDKLSVVEIPPERAGGWRVEEEFVNAIRGIEPITHTTLEDGVKYMEFTEAVHRSAESGRAISLPLT